MTIFGYQHVQYPIYQQNELELDKEKMVSNDRPFYYLKARTIKKEVIF